MKKIIVSTALLGGLMGMALFIQTPVHAVDTNKTDANITVSGGGLNIDELGKIDFEAITLNGKDQTAKPVDPKVPALNVHDYRGKTGGWYLQANYETKEKSLGNGMTLHVNPSSDQGGIAAPTDLGTDAATIYTLTTADLNNPDTTLTLNPTITVPKNTRAATYTATIVWNVVEGAPV